MFCSLTSRCFTATFLFESQRYCCRTLVVNHVIQHYPRKCLALPSMCCYLQPLSAGYSNAHMRRLRRQKTLFPVVQLTFYRGGNGYRLSSNEYITGTPTCRPNINEVIVGKLTLYYCYYYCYHCRTPIEFSPLSGQIQRCENIAFRRLRLPADDDRLHETRNGNLPFVTYSTDRDSLLIRILRMLVSLTDLNCFTQSLQLSRKTE
jgi:hypothetical protein